MTRRMIGVVAGLLMAVLCAQGRERIGFDFHWQFKCDETNQKTDGQLITVHPSRYGINADTVQASFGNNGSLSRCVEMMAADRPEDD